MDQEIINSAINNLKKITGIQSEYQEKSPLDGILKIKPNGQKYSFSLKFKKELRSQQILELERQCQQNPDLLLLAKRIFPKLKEALREKEIPYLEANGNIFIKKEGLFLFIDTEKTLESEKNKGNRAFTKTGLKVLYYLLQNKAAIHLTQRELADKTGVALGNIPQVIDGLKETGYLIPLNNKTYIWENREGIFQRWVDEYAIILRPKLLKERYSFKGSWQKIQLDAKKSAWGGEVAADLLTNHLRPEKLLIYSQENRMQLIKNYKLVQGKEGEIEVLEMFWKNNDQMCADPILVYAELIINGGKRNKEIAEKIYNEYIKPIL